MSESFTISLFKSVKDNVPKPRTLAWPEFCAKLSKPVVRASKDGTLFSPAKFVPALHQHKVSGEVINCDRACRNLNCVTELSLLVFDNDHNVTLEKLIDTFRKLKCAFAIYSTHSHRRATEKNTKAEPRYRVVVPLASPVPAAEYPAFYRAVAAQLGLKVGVGDQADIDNIIKNLACIYYTPAKHNATAPYEFRIVAGPWLDWQAVLNVSHASGPVASMVGGLPNGSSGPCELIGNRQSAIGADFATHEDRHAELCRRIAARGKQNTRGHYDAKCLAHNGRGSTSLCYFPDTERVSCNAGCDYFDILAAEGLSNNHLPSADRLARDEAREAQRSEVRGQRSVADSKLETPNSKPLFPRRADGTLTVPYLHTIYSALLAHFCDLSSDHEALIRKHWGVDPFALGEFETVPYFADLSRAERPAKMASMPNNLQKAIAANELSRWFDLQGVPGFFREVHSQTPAAPGTAAALIRDVTREWGAWRINLTSPKGLLVPYTDDRGFIIGIRIYRSVRDAHPTLLTSNGLPCGAKALMPREERAVA